MCSLTHNVAAIMIVYLQANLLPREPTIQTRRAPFSACFPACSLVAGAMDSPGPPQNNRDRDPTQITSSAPYLKTYVIFLYPPSAFLQPMTAYLLFFFHSLQLLRPEVERHRPLWSWLGSACGAGLGFITANVPGLVVGAYAGNRLGAIRDAKGKSVAAVFSELGATQKVEVR